MSVRQLSSHKVSQAACVIKPSIWLCPEGCCGVGVHAYLLPGSGTGTAGGPWEAGGHQPRRSQAHHCSPATSSKARDTAGTGAGEALTGWFPPIRSLLEHFPALTPWGKSPPPYSSIWSLLQPGRMLPRIRITARNGGVYYFFQARCQVFPMN